MKRLKILLVWAVICLPLYLYADNQQKFTVVIDAGHGGKDPGALGTKVNEKTLNLAVALELGKQIETKCKDVKVVYTRKTDVFLPLQERADIANKNKADLFICIHTNSAEAKSVAGAEVFTLGLNKTQSNLDVAMRENSVMLLEEGYQTKYKGFDPNSVDSYIMFEFMQDIYVDKSLDYAAKAQKELCSTAGRINRDVRQAGFWVLHKTSCPSVLVEMGFITNANEQAFLASTDGQKKIATALYNAFVDYKYEIDKKSGKVTDNTTQYAQNTTTTTTPQPAKTTTPAATQTTTQPAKTTTPTTTQPAKTTTPAATPTTPQPAKTTTPAATQTQKPIYKIQCFAVKQKLAPNDPAFKGVKNMTYYEENGWYKYTLGDTTSYDDLSQLLVEMKKTFPGCFIVAFRNGKKISVEEALR